MKLYKTYVTQRRIRRKRRKLPTAVKADEVVEDLCNPTVDQVEEEKTLNGCDSGWGRTSYILSQRLIRWKRRRLPTVVKAGEDIHEYIWPNGGTGRIGESSQWLWRQMRSYIVPPLRRKTLWTNLGRTDSSALPGNWPRRDNSDQKHQSFDVGRYEPSWQRVNRVPRHHSIIWPCRWLSIDVGSSLWIAARLGRRRAPSLKEVHLMLLTATLVLLSPGEDRVERLVTKNSD